MEKIVELELEPKKKKLFGRGFLTGLKSEFSKITWTPKDELFQCTKVVIFFVFVFGFGIYLTDLFIKGGLNWLNFLVQKIFG